MVFTCFKEERVIESVTLTSPVVRRRLYPAVYTVGSKKSLAVLSKVHSLEGQPQSCFGTILFVEGLQEGETIS